MPLQHEKHETGHDRRLPSTVARMVTTTRDVLKGTVDVSKFANQSMHRCGALVRHPCRPARLTRSSCLLWLTEAALSVNAGGGSKQKMHWGEDGREGQFEALSKR